jgi:hypothetical protein
MNIESAIGSFEIHRFEIPFQKYGDRIYIIPFGDVHRYSRNCSVEQWLEFLDWAKHEKNIYFLGMGDYDDFMSESERKSLIIATQEWHDDSVEDMNDMILDKIEKFYHEIKFMKGHLIGLVEGNHYSILKSGISSTQKLCEMLNCKYLGVNAFVRIVFRYMKSPKVTHSIDVFAHHGRGAARSGGASIAQVEEMAKYAFANLYLMGHDHKRTVTAGIPLLKLSDGNKIKVKEHERRFIRTGSFLRSYDVGKRNYVVLKALPPSSLGVVKVMAIPKRVEYVKAPTLNQRKFGGKFRVDDRYIDLHTEL